MKIIMFSFSLLVLLCMTMMLCNSIIKDGPLYMAGIVLTSTIFILSVILAVITGMELRKSVSINCFVVFYFVFVLGVPSVKIAHLFLLGRSV